MLKTIIFIKNKTNSQIFTDLFLWNPAASVPSMRPRTETDKEEETQYHLWIDRMSSVSSQPEFRSCSIIFELCEPGKVTDPSNSQIPHP